MTANEPEINSGTGWLETSAAAVEPIPVIGGVLAAILRASTSVRRTLTVIVILVLIYPIFSLFVALSATNYATKLLGPVGQSARGYMLSAVDLETFNIRLAKLESDLRIEERKSINSNNLVLDGSDLLTFSVEHERYGDELYIYSFVSGQDIQFFTFQTEKPSRDLPPGCGQSVTPHRIEDNLNGANIGQLNITQVGPGIGERNETQLDVPLSLGEYRAFLPNPKNKESIWTKLGLATKTEAPAEVVLQLKFTPSRDIINLSNCERFDTYIVVTYAKLGLPS